MKCIILLFLVTVIVNIGWTQQQNSNTLYTDEDLKGLGRLGPMSPGVRTIDFRYEGVKGTPLLFEEWKKAALQLKGQDGFGNQVLINIDGEKNILYFQLPGGYVSAMPGDKLAALNVEMNEGEYQLYKVKSAFEVEGVKDPVIKYYQSLYAGKFDLLKLEARFLVKADYVGPYSPDIRYDEYTSNISYWLREEGDDYQKVKLKRKSIEQALPNQAARIKKLVKENKIVLNDEKDLIQLLKQLELSDTNN